MYFYYDSRDLPFPEVQFKFSAKFLRFLYRNRKEKIFLVLEILINRPLCDLPSLDDLRNGGILKTFFAKDFNSGLHNLLALENLVWHGIR
jgi:hypothetical protein